jgi:hypothetical protein
MKILPIHQNSCRYTDVIVGYDEEFGGLAVSDSPTSEGDRIGMEIAETKKEIMMLANHGVMIGKGLNYDNFFIVFNNCLKYFERNISNLNGY